MLPCARQRRADQQRVPRTAGPAQHSQVAATPRPFAFLKVGQLTWPGWSSPEKSHWECGARKALHLHQFLLQHQTETLTRTVVMLQKPQPGHAGPFLKEHTKVCISLFPFIGERVPFRRSSDCWRGCIFFIYFANE